MTAGNSASTTRKSGRNRRRLGRGLQSLMSAPAKIDLSEAENSDTPELGEENPLAQRERSGSEESPENAVNRPNTPTNGDSTIDEPRSQSDASNDELRSVPIDRIEPNPYQPRGDIDESALDALASSIASAGVMQPIVVRPRESDHAGPRYQLIAGERRWRAATRLGLQTIPAVVRSVDDQTAAEWALVENLQREDLNPLERAEAFRRLSREFNLTHETIAEQVGLNRASISNHLRLLELDDHTKEALRDGRLTMGHARALLAITNEQSRVSLSRRAINEHWSVRRLEQAIRKTNDASSAGTQRENAAPTPGAMQTDALARRIGEALGTSVRIQPGKKKGTGKLAIDFYSFEQFEGLLERLGITLDE